MRRLWVAAVVLVAQDCTCSTALDTSGLMLTPDRTAVDFGVVPVGEIAHQSLLLTSEGGVVMVDSVVITGDAEHVFALDAGLPPLEANNPGVVDVAYTPLVDGVTTASLVVSLESDGLDDLVIPLAGRASGP